MFDSLRPSALAAIAAILPSFCPSCSTSTAPPRVARAALPLPKSLDARYAVPGPVQEFERVPIGGDGEHRYYRGLLIASATDGERREQAEFTFVTKPGAKKQPLVLLLPILAGGRNLMWILADAFATRGFAVLWTERVDGALQDHHDGADLEELLRRTVVHNRMALAWARAQPDVDPDRLGCVGVSMGSMIGTIVLALEPSLRGGALVLAGADLASLLRVSTEEKVARWRAARRRLAGIQGVELERELGRELRTDPERFAPYIRTSRVLMVHGTKDTIVPPSHQDRLWEALGRPERVQWPLGHYSIALALPFVLDRCAAFLRQRGVGLGRSG